MGRRGSVVASGLIAAAVAAVAAMGASAMVAAAPPSCPQTQSSSAACRVSRAISWSGTAQLTPTLCIRATVSGSLSADHDTVGMLGVTRDRFGTPRLDSYSVRWEPPSPCGSADPAEQVTLSRLETVVTWWLDEAGRRSASEAWSQEQSRADEADGELSLPGDGYVLDARASDSPVGDVLQVASSPTQIPGASWLSRLGGGAPCVHFEAGGTAYVGSASYTYSLTQLDAPRFCLTP